MCRSCWTDEYKAADVLDDNVTKAVTLIQAAYKVHDSMIGTMHAILEDWNLEMFDDIESEEYEAMTDEERACYEFMATLAVAQRASALARYEGWI